MHFTTASIITLILITKVYGEDYNEKNSNNDCDHLPDPADVASMARFIVHQSYWTSVSYISHSNKTYGWPMPTLFALSDGTEERGSGVPYFYVSPFDEGVSDLIENDSRCSLLMSLAQGSICKVRNWDPEDPRCAHIILSGTFQKIHNNSAEYDTAKTAVFTRHPSFVDLPESHKFFFAKLNIQRILVQDTFGGPSNVPVSDYFRADKHATCISIESSQAERNKLNVNILLFSMMRLLLSVICKFV